MTSTAGAPLADVEIVDGEDDTVTQTAADGSYEIGALDRGPARFAFKKEGYVPFALDVPPGRDDIDANVQLYRGVALSGRVVMPGGRPFAGAIVTATSRDAEPVYARTDDAGVFHLENLSPGRWDLKAGTRYDPNLGPPEDWLEGTLPDVDVERARDPIIATKRRISGTIYGDIIGIDRGLVRIQAVSSKQWSAAENDGPKYRMTTAPVGTVTVQASASVDGVTRFAQPVTVEVAPNGEVRADLRFPETFPVRGRVLENGEQVRFAVLNFADEHGNTATLPSKDGTYATELAAGRYHITVNGYSIDRTISGPAVIDVDIELAAIAVTVLDAATGAPVDSAEVGAREVAAEVVTVVEGRTDGNGHVALNVPRGVKAIVVEKDGYATAIVAVDFATLVVKLTRVTETVVRVVGAGSVIARDASGRVIASTGRTKDGKFYFRLAPGRYRFTASADGCCASQTIEADVPSNEIAIAMRP